MAKARVEGELGAVSGPVGVQGGAAPAVFADEACGCHPRVLGQQGAELGNVAAANGEHQPDRGGIVAGYLHVLSPCQAGVGSSNQGQDIA